MSPWMDQALEKALGAWAERLRQRVNLPLRVRWRDGQHALDLGHFAQPDVVIDVKDSSGAMALLSPRLDRLGEAYVEGHIDVSGGVGDILGIAHGLSASNPREDGARGPVAPEVVDVPPHGPSLLRRMAQRVSHAASDLAHSHSKASDQQAIAYHYDVSNDFYALWLDPAMVYSCAYFERGDETLAQAQQQKLDHILTKVRLQPGQRLLDIGCGWGALVLRAAEKYGAQCVGVTLSQNQHALATERVRAAGLQDRIEIRLQDYRDVQGPFDRITSVGMVEHVGLANLEGYFRRVHDLLAPDGWALNHGITSTDAFDRETAFGGGRFIDRYVFPDGELPHIGTVLTRMQQAGLETVDVEGLRRNYARTLQLWSEAFESQSATLRSMVDERRWRIWRVYLAGCQWAFAHDEISIFQVLCRRAGGSADTLPWSRRWMYEGDAAAR